ncbi:MAG TPA: hypothetical protein VGN42_26395 [Pirellulales bacterium]|jgi:DNA-binding NtrC family response regulator|nr:hypothetical protein [Pirellulales bacterium]
MHHCSLIFCERTGRWAAAWRQAWDRYARSGPHERAEIRTIETRSPDGCLQELQEFPAAFVILELAAEGCDRTLELLQEIATRHRGAAAAVAAERAIQEYEWPLRELGAAHFIVSPRELPSLCRMVERHAARSPRVELDLEARIWASLPWGR